MVNKKEHNPNQDDIEITNESSEILEPELEDVENTANQKIKILRDKLKETEAKLMDLREELQRSKADFLNAKRRLEEERLQDRKRTINKHIEKLLPICDSFYLAMLDKETWAKADEKWRQGIEGIYSQLMSLLNSYQVSPYDPTGEVFDHNRHEALAMVPVTEPKQNNHVLSVIQLGYEIINSDHTDIIRPARVTVGELKSN